MTEEHQPQSIAGSGRPSRPELPSDRRKEDTYTRKGKEREEQRRAQARKGDAQSSPGEHDQKAMSLMLDEHLIKLIEAITERETSESVQRTEPEQKLKQRKEFLRTVRAPW
jgi:hypothetical protein